MADTVIRPGLVAGSVGLEPVYTLANLITLLRTAAAMALAVSGILTGSLTLLVIGYLTYWIGDSADGNVARWQKRETRQGAVFDVLSDRACTALLAAGYLSHVPDMVLPLSIFLFQFMVVDTMLTMSFLHWPLLSPNYFYLVDRPIYRLNWSIPAKTVNTTVVVTLVALGWLWPATVVASTVLLIKLWSLHRVIGLLAERTSRKPASAAAVLPPGAESAGGEELAPVLDQAAG